MQKTTSSGYAEFSEYLIASCTTQQLLENLLMDFIFSLGLHGATQQKIKEMEVSFEPKTRLNRQAQFVNMLHRYELLHYTMAIFLCGL